MKAFDTITYEKIGAVARIMLNRPETHNAQNYHMIFEIDDAIQDAEADAEIRVIVLGGHGKSFSSGHDLRGQSEGPVYDELRKSIEGRTKVEQEVYVDKCLNIRNTKKPTICAVQGHCIAAGVMVVAMCDLIIAAEDAKFQNPVVRMTPGGAELLVELWELGARKAKEFLFTGDAIDAQEAWRLGMVNRVVPNDKLMEEVMELANRIALVPPVSLQLVKHSINHCLDLMGQDATYKYHFLIHQISHTTAEAENFKAERAKAGGGVRGLLSVRDGKFNN